MNHVQTSTYTQRSLNFPQENNFLTLLSISRLVMSALKCQDRLLIIFGKNRKRIQKNSSQYLHNILYFGVLFANITCNFNCKRLIYRYFSAVYILVILLSLLPLFILQSYFCFVVLLYSLGLFLSTSPSTFSFLCNAVLKDKNMCFFPNWIFNNTLSP